MSIFTPVTACTHVAARRLGLPVLLTTLALALPLAAQAQNTVTPAAGTSAPSAAPATPAPSTTAKRPVRRAGPHGIEARIADLHKRLKITSAEEDQWKQVADIMRQNSAAIDAAIKDRAEHAKTMNAMENMESYGKIADAHADGMKRLLPAFQTLYDSMPDAQKKNADEVFRAFAQRHNAPRHAAKKSG